MKLKHLLALAVAAVCTTGAWAQTEPMTDVTNYILTNADFSQTAPLEKDLYGYKGSGRTVGPQEVDGWLHKKVQDDGNGQGWAGAVFVYGTSYKLIGNSKNAPSTGPNDSENGKYLGFFSVNKWGGYYYQDVKLPAGDYKLTFSINCVSGTVVGTSYTGFFPNEGDGLTVEIPTKTEGWVDKTVEFTLAEDTEGQIRIGHLSASSNSGSANSPMLYFDHVTIESTVNPVDVAKAALQETINSAPEVRTTNIGNGPFQYASDDVDNYNTALTAAQTAHDADDATVESLSAAKTELENAIAVYNALTINEPAQGQLFAIVLTYEGYTYDKKAMTLKPNAASNQGNYRLYYQEEVNVNLAQAFTFTKVEGNKYQLSIIGTDGTTLYLTDSKTGYGGDGLGIRVTTEETKAAAFTIIPTSTEGVYNIYNNAAKDYIGSRDQGVYTVNSHIDFKIVETQKPSVAINTSAAGWGTVILPFAASELPADVKAYTCAAVNGATLTLAEVNALEANKPYIIEGAWETTLTGDAQGTALTYTEGLLTGTYADMEAINGTYIMQKHDDKVGFYQVDTESAKPKVPANRAYLTAPSAGVKAFVLGEDIAVAIQSVFDGLVKGQAYDLAGRKVSHFQGGGVYIVNGKKVMVNK